MEMVDTSKINEGDYVKAEFGGMITKDWHKVTTVIETEVAINLLESQYVKNVFGTEHGQWFDRRSITEHRSASGRVEIELPEVDDSKTTLELRGTSSVQVFSNMSGGVSLDLKADSFRGMVPEDAEILGRYLIATARHASANSRGGN